MNIIDKLGISKAPWSTDESDMIEHVDDATGNAVAYDIGSAADKFIISAAPEMLEALIHGILMVENMNKFIDIDSAEYVFRFDSIGCVEKATGKSWEEIKALID